MDTFEEANNVLLELTSHELDVVGGGLCVPYAKSITVSRTCEVAPPYTCTTEVSINFGCL